MKRKKKLVQEKQIIRAHRGKPRVTNPSQDKQSSREGLVLVREINHSNHISSQ